MVSRTGKRGGWLAGAMLLAGCAAGGLWFVTGPSRSGRAERPAASAERAPRPAELVPAGAESSAPRQVRLEVAADAATVVAADEGDLVLRVLESDGSVAPGASVAMLDSLRAFVRGQELVSKSGDPDEEFARALRRTTDGRGRVLLPRPRGNGRVAAWHDGRYGELALFPGEPGPLELVLAEDAPIEVRVVASDGRPRAGMPVVLRTPKTWVARRSTGADGIVQLFARGRQAELDVLGAFVQLAIPLREAVSAPVEDEREGPIELVAPELGAVVVRLLDGPSEFRGAAHVRLGLTEGLAEKLAPEARSTGFLDTLAHDGRADFALVGLGLEFFALARPEGRAESGSEIHGPTRAGEVVEVPLSVGADCVRLTGHLRGADGAALGEAFAEFLLDTPGGHAARRRVLTDAEGGFTVAYQDFEEAATAETLEVTVLAPPGSEHAGTFPVRLADGVNELGALTLARQPLLVAGRVLDEGGTPLRGVPIEVLRRFDPANPVSGEPLNAKVVSDALGHFALHRPAPEGGGLAVRVRHPRFRWGAEVVAPGTSALEIVVRATGSIALQVQYEGGWSPQVQLLQQGERVAQQALRIGNGWRWQLEDVLPGEYDLEWFHPWASERGIVRGLRVVAGEETSDPRLLPLDLRGAWPRVRLAVVDEAREPCAGARLDLWRDGKFAPYVLKPGGHELDVVAGPLPLRARLSAAGFRARELLLEADATIVLVRGPRLRLQVPALPELPRDWQWAIWIRPASARENRSEPRTLTPGTLELTLEAAGPHELFVGAVRRHDTWNDEAGGGGEFELEIKEELTLFTLPPPDAAQLDAVRAEIAENDPFAPR